MSSFHRPFSRRQPLVAGESPSEILRIVRGFPVSVNGVGRITLENTATGPDAEIFARAYEFMERELLEAEQWCSAPWEHSTLGEDDHRWMILNALMWETKRVAGQLGRLEWGWNGTWRRPACGIRIGQARRRTI